MAVTLLNSIGLFVFVMEILCVFCITGTKSSIVIERTNGVLFAVRPVCAGKLFSNGHPLTVFCSHKSRTVADCLLDIRDTGEVGGKSEGSLLIDLLHAAIYIDLPC
jgi:hypothetical protein